MQILQDDIFSNKRQSILRTGEISSVERMGERQRSLNNTKYYISKIKQKIFNLYIVRISLDWINSFFACCWTQSLPSV